jgi:hypothetical protein
VITVVVVVVVVLVVVVVDDDGRLLVCWRVRPLDDDVPESPYGCPFFPWDQRERTPFVSAAGEGGIHQLTILRRLQQCRTVRRPLTVCATADGDAVTAGWALIIGTFRLRLLFLLF